MADESGDRAEQLERLRVPTRHLLELLRMVQGGDPGGINPSLHYEPPEVLRSAQEERAGQIVDSLRTTSLEASESLAPVRAWLDDVGHENEWAAAIGAIGATTWHAALIDWVRDDLLAKHYFLADPRGPKCALDALRQSILDFPIGRLRVQLDAELRTLRTIAEASPAPANDELLIDREARTATWKGKLFKLRSAQRTRLFLELDRNRSDWPLSRKRLAELCEHSNERQFLPEFRKAHPELGKLIVEHEDGVELVDGVQVREVGEREGEV